MTYIVKFVPNAGGMPTQGLFEKEETAKHVYEKALESVGVFAFKDDWGFNYAVGVRDCAIVLMDLETSVKMSIHMAQEQERLARKHGGQTSPQGIISAGGFIPRQ